MSAYHLLSPLWQAFYSKNLYREVAKNWRGKAFLYLLLLLALSWLPIFIQGATHLSHMITQQAPGIVQQIPTIEVHQGKLSIDKPSPYKIIDPDTQQTLVIIDTSGHYKDLENTKAEMLVTRDVVITRINETQTRTYSIAKIADQEKVTFTNNDVSHILTIVKDWMLALMFPLVLLVAFVYRIVQALFYSLFGLLFANFSNVKLEYAALFSLTIVALTPALIIDKVFMFFSITFPLQFLFCFIVSMFYLHYAVAANRLEPSASVN